MARSGRHAKVNVFEIAARKIGAAAIALALALGIQLPAMAVNAVTISSSAASVSGGNTITLTATMPALAAGTYSETLVHKFDNTKFALSSASQIVAPAGWTIYYSTDSGVTWSSATPTNWALVNAVKAGGVVNSGGTSGNNQIASQAAVGISAVDNPYQPHADGDGWEAIADTTGHVWNVFHHNGGVSAALDCHLRTSASCGSVYPFDLNQYGINSSNRNYLVVDETRHRLLMPTTCFDKNGGSPDPCGANKNAVGVACIDVSSPQSPSLCGSANGFIKLGLSDSGGDKGAVSGGVIVNNKLYALDGGIQDYESTGSDRILMCLDLATYQKCAGSPYALPGSDSVKLYSTISELADLIPIGTRIYGSAGELMNSGMDTRVPHMFCWDTVTEASCSGWSSSKILNQRAAGQNGDSVAKMLGVKDSSGVFTKICAVMQEDDVTLRPASEIQCFTLAGATTTTPSWVSGQLYQTVRDDNFGWGSFTTQANKVQWTATRAYWVTAGTSPGNDQAQYNCYDVTISANCPNWPAVRSNVAYGYTINTDPLNPNCLWTNVDWGGLLPIDALTGAPGCSSTPGTHADFRGNSSMPRLGCSASGASILNSFTTIQMTGPSAAGAFSAPKLSILDSNGAWVAGWVGVAPTSYNGTLPVWDASTLSPAVVGADPTFMLDFGTYTSASFAQLSVLGISASPQLCINPTALTQCGPQGFFNASNPLTSAVAAFEASGSYTQNSITTTLSAASTNVTIAAAAVSDCKALIIGQTWTYGYNDNYWVNVPNVIATLGDAAGNPIIGSNGQPITATVAADGSFSFVDVVPASYTVNFSDSSNPTFSHSNVTYTRVGFGTSLTQWQSNGTPSSAPVSAMSLTTQAFPVGVNHTGVVFGYYVPGPLAPSRADSATAGTPIVFDPYATVGSSAAASPTPGSSFSGNAAIPALVCTSSFNPCSATSATIAGQGTYSVNPATSRVTFTPIAGFVGTATPIDYTVTDASGQTASGSLTPTFVAAPTPSASPSSTPSASPSTSPSASPSASPSSSPSASPISNSNASSPSNQIASVVAAVPDSITSPYLAAQTYSPLENDSSLAVSGTVLLCGIGQTPLPAGNGCTETKVTVAGQGTFSISSSNKVIFTPVETFYGVAKPIAYQVATTSDSTHFINSTISPVILEPKIAAKPQVLHNVSGPNKTVTFINLDRAAGSLGTSSASLVTSATCLFALDEPSVCKTQVSTGHGSFTLDPNTGLVKFTSSTSARFSQDYINTIGYRITNVVGQHADSTLKVYTETASRKLAETGVSIEPRLKFAAILLVLGSALLTWSWLRSRRRARLASL